MNRSDFPAFSAVNWEGIHDDVRDYARWFMMEFLGDDERFPGYHNVTFSLVDTGHVLTTPASLTMNFGLASDFVSGRLLKGGTARLELDPKAYVSEKFLDFLRAESCGSEQASRALTVLENVLTPRKACDILSEFGFTEDKVWGMSKSVGEDEEDFMIAQVTDNGRSVDVKLHAEDDECEPILTVVLRTDTVEKLRVAIAAAQGPWLESRGFGEGK